MIRNLLFHCYPRAAAAELWTWHIDQLLKYKPVWSGRRIVVVVLDKTTSPETLVRQKLAPLEAEILVRPNQALHETTHFLEALGELQSLRQDEATFYAHTKGVSHCGPPKYGFDQAGIKRWTQALYQLNLSRPDLIDRVLEQSAVAGAFRVHIRHADANWLYSGTYFWMRHSAIFSRNWKDIYRDRTGVEGYPGRHFTVSESFALPPVEIDHTLLYGGYVTEAMLKFWQTKLEAL